MHIYVYVYVIICMCVYMYTQVCKHKSTYIHADSCIHIYIYVNINRKDCCGVYIMDENRLNKPYNSVFTHVLQYIVPHPYFQFFAR